MSQEPHTPYHGQLYWRCADCGRNTYARKHPSIPDAAICPPCDWTRTFGFPLTRENINEVAQHVVNMRKQ